MSRLPARVRFGPFDYVRGDLHAAAEAKIDELTDRVLELESAITADDGLRAVAVLCEWLAVGTRVSRANRIRRVQSVGAWLAGLQAVTGGDE